MSDIFRAPCMKFCHLEHCLDKSELHRNKLLKAISELQELFKNCSTSQLYQTCKSLLKMLRFKNALRCNHLTCKGFFKMCYSVIV